jgi:hypothetical protein
MQATAAAAVADKAHVIAVPGEGRAGSNEGTNIMNKVIGIVVLLAIAVAGYYGYRQFAAPSAPAGGGTAASGGASAPATPPAGGLPDAVMAQVKQGIDASLAAVPNITPEQKTKISECAVKAVGASVKPEDMAKLASDPAAAQTLMAGLANSMKPCMAEAGLPAQ